MSGAGATLSIEDCCPDQGSRVPSVLIEGRWFSQNQLQCVSGQRGRIIRGWYYTEVRGYIDRGPSSLRLCNMQRHRYYK